MDWVKEAFQKTPNKPKGWVSVSDIQRETGQAETTIRHKLKSMVDNGLLEKMWCIDNGVKVLCYRKKGKK